MGEEDEEDEESETEAEGTTVTAGEWLALTRCGAASHLALGR